MQVSVVIPCHGGAALSRRCLASLFRQVGDHDLEVVLVDNKSPDDTSALASFDPRIRVLSLPRNLGFAGGVNRGLHAARHPFLLVLNNDTLAAPDLLEKLHRAATAHQRIGLVAPVSNHVKGEARIAVATGSGTPAGCARIAAELDAACAGVVQDAQSLSGLCLLMHRTVWQRIGDFDERFGHGNFEDDDYCLRARLLGYRLLIARDAFLHHEGHATFRAMGLDLGEQLQTRGAQFATKWVDDPAGTAWLALQRGDLEGAATAALAARARWPRWPDADWILGLSCAARGDRRALLHLGSYVRACPRSAEGLLQLGQAAIVHGEPALAQRALGYALSHCHVSDRRAAALFAHLGELARQRKLPGEAVRNLALATGLAPDDAELQNHLAVTLFEDGQWERAIAVLEAARAKGSAAAAANLGHARTVLAAAGR
jgi:GT2 family glycosyltransferase